MGWQLTSCSSGNRPRPRVGHAAVFRPRFRDMIIFGGTYVTKRGTYIYLNDVWSFDTSKNLQNIPKENSFFC